MNARHYFLAILSAGLLSLPLAVRADDIDIYAGLGSAANAPNLMFVLDSASNSSANFGTCKYDKAVLNDGLGGAPSQGSSTLGNDQCALYNVVLFLPTRTITDPATGTQSQVALMKVGITTSNGVYFPLTPIDDNTYAGPFTLTLGSNTITIPANFTDTLGYHATSNRDALLSAITQIYNNTGTADFGDMMQETWAYYTGGIGTYNGINTAVGMVSNTTYSGTTATSGCQKNYVVFVGAVRVSAHGNDSNSGKVWDQLNAAVNLYENNLVTLGQITSADATKAIADLTSLRLDGLNPDKYVYSSIGTPKSPPDTWVREWAYFMNQADVNSTAAGSQDIVTYSVSVVPPGHDNPDEDNLVHDIADYGGGKYFNVSSYSDLYNSLLKVLNEVQAVNSVFSSSSLPVSVNAQGTYLNQIYMGMFRPDAEANPRWTGNLKQYQFIFDPTTRTLHLGDSLGNLAISSSGTGFISPNAISFWTCTAMTSGYSYPSAYTSVPNSYVTTSLTSAQVTLLKTNKQDCYDPLGKGFWVSDPSASTTLAKGYDLPDGERVERGGAAQRNRLRNYYDDYTQAAGTFYNSRNLYTYCPSGTGCVAALTDPSNAFATSNAGITPNMFGTNVYINILNITRTGNLATVTTDGANNFNVGDQITIANASPGNYNGNFTVQSVVAANVFTIPVTETPPTPATGSYDVADYSQVTFTNLVSLAITGRTINADGTVSATVTGDAGSAPNPPLGVIAGNPVTIQNATPANYNGTYKVLSATTSPTYQFTYQIPESPPAAAGSTSTLTATATGYTNASCKASATLQTPINLVNTTTPSSSGVYRDPNSATPGTVTINTTLNISGWVTKCGVTLTGVVDSYGNPVAAYNGTFAPLSIGTTSFTIGVTVSPVTPASSTTGATMQAGGATLIPVTLSLVDNAGSNPPSATVTGDTGTTATNFKVGDSISIIDAQNLATPNPANEAAYKGNFAVSSVTATTVNQFTYVINTSPPNPTALTGTQMTATRTTGLSAADMDALINWVRGQDNKGDEPSLCPGGVSGTSAGAIKGANYANCNSPVVTTRPSMSGDVLHSRPTVLNYGSYPVNITSTSDFNGIRTAQAPSADVTNISNAGATPVVTFANLQMCPVTVTSPTSFTYSATSCGDAGAQIAHVGEKIVVFYGDNDGIFHAVNGNQTADFGQFHPGQEIWGFIPKELFYGKLARQRNNSPQLDLPSTPPGITPQPRGKDYFVDGATGVYQVIDGNGNTERAILYLSMRRGGNFIYAIDVTHPGAPWVIWEDTGGGVTPGMNTLTQTWSQPKVAWVQGYQSHTDPQTAQATPLVFFGGGYDVNEDNDPVKTPDTAGFTIYAVDALNGFPVWAATSSKGGPTACGGGSGTLCKVSGMDYAIPGDITLVDRNNDGYIDRLYAGDLGGNIWRVDLEPGCNGTYPCTTDNPKYWNVTRLAALGCNYGPCPAPTSSTTASPRKFFYPPEVIPKTSANTYDTVIIGSGDREHPLQVSSSTSSANGIFLIKDFSTGDDATANANAPASTGNYISMYGTYPLYDATTTSCSGSADIPDYGFFMSLGLGEKVVNAPLAVAGYVYLSTNTPPSPTASSCTSALGTARGYQISPFACSAQSVVFDGGGLPPSPVAGIVNVVVGDHVEAMPFIIGGANPNCKGPDCHSALGGQKPVINVPTTRHRNYWYIKGK